MFTFGLTVALLGMSVVFSALLMLIFVIMLLSATARCITASITKKNMATKDVTKAQETVAYKEISCEDDEDLAVVLAAAIAAFGSNKESFIPLKQERNTAHPAWFQAGCEEAVSLKSFSY